MALSEPAYAGRRGDISRQMSGTRYLGQIRGNMAKAHHIVFANEKGGTGKSTTAVHVAIALASRGARVACIDLDSRQRTLFRYLENRRDTIARRRISLPMPVFEVFEHDSQATLDRQVERLGAENDFLIFDTPGRDDKYARLVATRANTLVTPINDSFVDFDLIGQVDAENFKVRKLSFYAELIWEARKERAKTDGVTIDWIVVQPAAHDQCHCRIVEACGFPVRTGLERARHLS
jgi:chromosome partitioning protein